MPGNLNAGDIIECVIFGVADGQAVLNVFHYRMRDNEEPGAEDPVPIDTVALGVRTIWRTQVLPNLSETYRVVQYQATRIAGKTVVPGSDPVRRKLSYDQRAVIAGVLGTDVGADALDPHPTFAAVGILKRTGLAGRSGRGAIRIGPVSDQTFDGNNIDPVFAATWHTAALNLFVGSTPFNPSDSLYAQGIVFRKTEYLKSAVPLEPPDLFFADITTVQVRAFASSQVSRKKTNARGA